MFNHLLIATDGSPLSQNAAMRSLKLAQALAARVSVITVSLPFPVFTLDHVMVGSSEAVYNDERNATASQDLAAIGSAARSAGVPCEEVHVFHEDAHAAIIAAAEQRDCDLICMASHSRAGLTTLVVGSETMKVMTHSQIPVLVFR